MSITGKIKKAVAIAESKAEKTFTGEQGIPVHYIFRKRRSRILLVVFSALNSEGPRYSYLSVTRFLKMNQLFIRDDFAGLGTYYLGPDRSDSVESEVLDLIGRTAAAAGAEHIVFAGSSKGGTAALFFGLQFPGAVIVSAAPQYYIGDYIQSVKKLHPSVPYILGKTAGEMTREDIGWLNTRVSEKIRTDKHADSQKCHIHCSSKDSTFELHVQPLLKDLEEAAIRTELDLGSYEEHFEVKNHFPGFLRHVLSEISDSRTGRDDPARSKGRGTE
ncbi:MAG: hypothetical protein IJ930_07420 [Lachnospiraceae bacterium]|nr:hypothetical protein [Lachnospiraceae bacterium]